MTDPGTPKVSFNSSEINVQITMVPSAFVPFGKEQMLMHEHNEPIRDLLCTSTSMPAMSGCKPLIDHRSSYKMPIYFLVTPALRRTEDVIREKRLGRIFKKKS